MINSWIPFDDAKQRMNELGGRLVIAGEVAQSEADLQRIYTKYNWGRLEETEQTDGTSESGSATTQTAATPVEGAEMEESQDDKLESTEEGGDASNVEETEQTNGTSPSLADLTVKDLREKFTALGIEGSPSRMNKSELVEAITNATKS